MTLILEVTVNFLIRLSTSLYLASIFINRLLFIQTNLRFRAQNLLELPKFKTALEYRDRFTFGIDKLDEKLDYI